eukprot:364845-Chlamydomonas_euryale.AAC.7
MRSGSCVTRRDLATPQRPTPAIPTPHTPWGCGRDLARPAHACATATRCRRARGPRWGRNCTAKSRYAAPPGATAQQAGSRQLTQRPAGYRREGVGSFGSGCSIWIWMFCVELLLGTTLC